jgi:hypothetical protein
MSQEQCPNTFLCAADSMIKTKKTRNVISQKNVWYNYLPLMMVVSRKLVKYKKGR